MRVSNVEPHLLENEPIIHPIIHLGYRVEGNIIHHRNKCSPRVVHRLEDRGPVRHGKRGSTRGILESWRFVLEHVSVDSGQLHPRIDLGYTP